MDRLNRGSRRSCCERRCDRRCGRHRNGTRAARSPEVILLTRRFKAAVVQRVRTNSLCAAHAGRGDRRADGTVPRFRYAQDGRRFAHPVLAAILNDDKLRGCLATTSRAEPFYAVAHHLVPDDTGGVRPAEHVACRREDRCTALRIRCTREDGDGLFPDAHLPRGVRRTDGDLEISRARRNEQEVRLVHRARRARTLVENGFTGFHTRRLENRGDNSSIVRDGDCHVRDLVRVDEPSAGGILRREDDGDDRRSVDLLHGRATCRTQLSGSGLRTETECQRHRGDERDTHH